MYRRESSAEATALGPGSLTPWRGVVLFVTFAGRLFGVYPNPVLDVILSLRFGR